ncbi:MAG: hypothetical protein C0418_00820 [Coriobacteriaceae bacterium]|nr:hypothetical protein [Coriobacteriaceae bacterium]
MPASRAPGRGYVLAGLAAACWALSGLTAKWLFTPAGEASLWRVPAVGAVVDPVTLAAARALVAFALLTLYLAVRRRADLRIRPRDLPFMAAFGVFGLAMVHFTYFKTISLTGVATAILLEYLAPVITLVFSVLFLGERLNWSLPAGVALSITGCALVVGALGGAGLRVSSAGVAWGLASAGFFALYSILGRYAAGRFTPWTLLAYGLGAATVFWLVYLGPARVLAPLGDGTAAAAVVFIAVVGTIVPFGAFLKALEYIDATKATVTATAEPVIAGLGAFALFGEVLTLTQLLGGVLVVVAIAIVQRAAARTLPFGD